MTAGTISATTTATAAFNPLTPTDGPAAAVSVKNASASGGNVLVNVDGCHAAGEWDVLEPGDGQVYRAGYNGIGKVLIKSDSTATAYFAVVARNPAMATH